METGFKHESCVCYITNFFPQSHSRSVCGWGVVRTSRSETERINICSSHTVYKVILLHTVTPCKCALGTEQLNLWVVPFASYRAICCLLLWIWKQKLTSPILLGRTLTLLANKLSQTQIHSNVYQSSASVPAETRALVRDTEGLIGWAGWAGSIKGSCGTSGGQRHHPARGKAQGSSDSTSSPWVGAHF